MQRVTPLILLMILLSAITQSVRSQEGFGSGGGLNYKTAPTKPVLTAEQIAQRFLPSVVLIICDDGKGNYSQGTGYIVQPGIILTNAHVVKGMVRGVVVISGKEEKKYLINKIGHFNSENTDLALLGSYEARSVKTPGLPLAQPNDLRIGETIYVLSNPKGLSGTISQGIVSSGIRQMKNMELLQITAPISEGSSGGAVMNSRGEVVGIATSSLQSGQNLNFAVPAAQISLFIEEFLDRAKNTEYISASKFPASWIAPKSFLELTTKNSGNTHSTSVPSVVSNPTLKETTDWISEKLEGTTAYEITEYKNSEKYERLRFEGCKMYLEGEFTSSPNPGVVRFSYSPNLNTLSSAEARVTKDGDNIVRLNFKKNIVGGVSYYNRGYYKTKKPDEIEKDTRDGISIFINTKDMADRTAKAFNRVIELCSQNVREPF